MNSKEEESSGIFSVYCPVGLIGQTWFISCLFFMKLRPQKWQGPVLLVTAPAPGPELWLSRADEPEAVLLSVRPELVLVLGRRVRLTRDRGGGLRKSEHVRSACYLAGIVYIEKYRNAATLQKPIPIWFVFPQDLHKNEWPRN